MRVDGQLYIVANMGFKPVEEIKLRQMFI